MRGHARFTAAASTAIPPGTQLTALWFADASHGWAGGAAGLVPQHGVILATTDGGHTWAAQLVPPDLAAVQAISFVDATQGWAVGQDRAGSPEVVTTTTGGAAWTRVPMPVGLDAQPGNFTRASFVDRLHGWVSGFLGGGPITPTQLMLATVDGGATWVDESASLPDWVQSLAFTSPTTGWLGIQTEMGGALYRSTDAGHSWAQQTGISFKGAVVGIRFVDPSDGFVVSQGPSGGSTVPGQASITHDGGQTWQTSSLSANTVWSVAAADAQHAWAVVLRGADTGIDATTDGSTWHEVQTTTTANAGMLAPAGSNLVAIGGGCGRPSAELSDDGGVTWTATLTLPTSASAAPLELDPLIMETRDPCNESLGLTRTVNGTTSPITLPAGALVSAVFKGDTGWVMMRANPNSSDLQQWKTTDVGNTWQSQTPPDPQGAYVYYDSAHWIIENFDQLSVTSDGGNTYTTVNQALGAVTYIDTTHLWATGPLPTADSVPWTSSDGGLTWRAASVLSDRDDRFVNTDFLDATHAWIAGQNPFTQVGFMAYTADGGQTWAVTHLSAGVGVSSLQFAPNSSTGWRVVTHTNSYVGTYAVNSALQVTHDAGAHWTLENLPGDLQFVNAVEVIDSTHAAVQGTDAYGRSVVEETTDGGLTWTFLYPTDWQASPGVAPPPPPGPFSPVAPVRLCDTRPASATEAANQCSGRRLGTAGNGRLNTLDLQTAGVAGLPSDPSQYSAVILHVTATGPDTSSYITSYAAGVPRPLASSINTSPRHTDGNLVEVATGTDGHLELFNAQGTTDLVVDLEGYVPVNGSGSGFTGVTPFRVCDTRPASSLNTTQCAGHTAGSGAVREVQVSGIAGSNVPASGVSAVVLNATVTGPTQASYLTVYPTGTGRPLASSLNYVPGQIVANRVTVPVGPCSSGVGSCVSIYNYTGNADVVLDIDGYYSGAANPSSGGVFTALNPSRICDTRAPAFDNLTPCAGQSLSGGSPLSLQVAGAAGVPANAKAVVANVTVTGSSDSGYLTVYPGTQSPPLASDVNFTTGQTVANLTVTALGSDGTIDLYVPWGTADVVVDVVGYYS